MPIQQYPNLDGEVLFGKVVYLLGSAELGPKNKPMLIERERDLINVFGTKGSLVDAYRQVKAGSQDNKVYLCKTTGEHAVVRLNLNVPGQDKVYKDGLIISSVYANEMYNDIKITITSEYIMFSFPFILRTPAIVYRYSEYPTLFHLIRGINKDTRSKKNHVFVQCVTDVNIPTASAIHSVNPIEVYMYGGSSGLNANKNELYYALDTTYGLLLGDDVDIIVPLDAFIDDITVEETSYMDPNTVYLSVMDFDGEYVTFYNQLLEHLVKQMEFGMITRGIMGFRTTKDKYLNDDFEGYKQYAKYFLNSNQQRSSVNSLYFGLIDVCIGDVYYDYGSMLGNHYTAYAGLVSALPLNEHPTNKAYSKSITLRNEFMNEHFLDLMENSLVGVRVSPLTDLVTVVNGVTSAPSASDFHYACNIRMVQTVAYYAKRLFEKYIGEDMTSLVKSRKALKDLEDLLKYLQEKGVIAEYKASITDDPKTSSLRYTIMLKTIYMIEFVGLSNSIKYIAGDSYV